MERVIDKMFCTVFEHCFGIMNYVSAYHHEHPLFSRVATTSDYKLVEEDLVSGGDVVLYSGGSFMDYVYLTEKYSPVFCIVAKDETPAEHVLLKIEIDYIGSTRQTELATDLNIFYWP